MTDVQPFVFNLLPYFPATLTLLLTLLYRELMKDPVRLRENRRELVHYMIEEETEAVLRLIRQLLELSQKTRNNSEKNTEEDYAKKLYDMRPVIERFSNAMHLSGQIEAIIESLPPRRGYIVRMAIVAVLSLVTAILLVNGILTFNTVLIMIGLLGGFYLAILFHEAYRCNETADIICNTLYRRADALKYNYKGGIESVRSYTRFCPRSEKFSQGGERSRGSRSSR